MTQPLLSTHPATPLRIRLLAPGVFLLLAVAFFNTALFDTSTVVASKGTDVALQFLPWRQFGFDQLRQGNLALWNPHIYGGTPYFAGFQSALLYPPNWLHLLMPVGLAINWINALHIFLAGLFTYLWCRHRGTSRAGGILAGMMFMFSGPYLPHIYAGHLPHLAVMVWAPLLFLAIDLVMEGSLARGTLLGTFVMAMFILAGHPQYVYYTGMAAAVYVLIGLVRAKSIPLALFGCALIVIGGAALAAIQLCPGIAFVSESIRNSGTDYHFSAMFSFPPENLLTTLTPNVFGRLALSDADQLPITYFGRCYLWEVSLFVSLSGLFLALYGAAVTVRQKRPGALILAVICLILALGAHTPLHHFLYDFLPGFASFRGSTKFNYLVALFLSLLAANGFDAMVAARKPSWRILAISAALPILILVFAGIIHHSAQHRADGTWNILVRKALDAGYQSMEVYIPKALLTDDILKQAGIVTSTALLYAAIPAALFFVCLLLLRIKPYFAYGLILLSAAELLIYGFGTRATMGTAPPLPANVQEAIRSVPSDQRILTPQMDADNLGMWFGFDDVWGYDPGVLKRYAQLVAASQKTNPDEVTQYVNFQAADPRIFPLLRCGAAIFPDGRKIQFPPPMLVAQLVPTTFVLAGEKPILSYMQSDYFNPRQMVLLESAPTIKPVYNADPGDVRIIHQTTDRIDLEANAHTDTMLLVTNAYSSGWHAEALSPGPQDHYDVIPADWAFQAIPLRAGKHQIRLEYRPESFVWGKWISIVAILLYLSGATFYVVKSRRIVSPADSMV